VTTKLLSINKGLIYRVLELPRQSADTWRSIAMSEDSQFRLTSSDEYEEISSEEVDRVVEALDRLIEGVQSENIKHYLEEAASNIYYLVYEEEEDLADDSFEQAA
jgi:hypothetical protein